MFNLLHYKKAAYAAIAVETYEEERLLKNILSLPAETSVYLVTAAGGLRDLRNNTVPDPKANFGTAFKAVSQMNGAILVVYDFQAVIKNALAYRSLKECFPDLKDKGSMIVLVAPSWSMPAELSHDLPVLQFDLPTRPQLKKALDVIVKATDIQPTDEEALLDAAAGLSLQEAENAFALALVENKSLDAPTVEREKMRLVKSSGFLEVTAPADPASIGGLQALKDYINDEVIPAKGDEVLRVKGVMMIGPAGTGKSLTSKAIGAMLKLPVLRMDMASLKGGFVGQSESNINQALKLCDAIAPCVLWIDEIEKGVGGYASSAQSDGGTTLGMVGILLTWMAEHKSPVIVCATCNDFAKLPTELTRAGRFDERFFVDLPSFSERIEIARVHLAKYCGLKTAAVAENKIAELTASWTGSEIEQLIKSAARRTRRHITGESLEACAKDIKPISQVKKDEIDSLRETAKTSFRFANTPEVKGEAGRKVVVN